MQLRSGLALLPLDDEFVLFSENAQRIIGLNAPAALVFRELQRGAEVSELEGALVSQGHAAPDNAQLWVSRTLEAFSDHGILAGNSSASFEPEGTPQRPVRKRPRPASPALAEFVPVTEHCYRLLDTRVLIRFASSAQRRLVDSVLGHLRSDDGAAPDVVIDLPAIDLGEQQFRTEIYRDGEHLDAAPRLSFLGPIVKGAVWQSAVNAQDFLFYIHAGVVAKNEACILLPGAAGSGKSSVTTVLTYRGFRYLSDEVALIDHSTMRVLPMPLALCSKSTGWDVIAPYFPEIATLPTHRRGDGKIVRYLPPSPETVCNTSARVSHIVFPRYDGNQTTALESLSRTEALRRLMDECWAVRQRLNQNLVEELVQWIAGIECYTLPFSSLDEAADLVEAMLQMH